MKIKYKLTAWADDWEREEGMPSDSWERKKLEKLIAEAKEMYHRQGYVAVEIVTVETGELVYFIGKSLEEGHEGETEEDDNTEIFKKRELLPVIYTDKETKKPLTLKELRELSNYPEWDFDRVTTDKEDCCGCKRGKGVYYLFPETHEAVLDGGKRYFVCDKCGNYGHL